ncbi:MAG: roadblock/LC7 domain-containing protein [Gemmatimonadaceae bacterium]|nr:roadblock/LC7 domain-containing protein [Gemmatimonadaceae bacterium]
MPTIHDLVAAIRDREGVQAAVVLGRDGLVIDAQALSTTDTENVAAHVPPVLLAAEDLGHASSQGPLQTAVLEHERGYAIVASLSPEAVLLVLALPSVNLAQLLYELRRNRANIASLV